VGATCSQRLRIGIHGVRAPPPGRSQRFGYREGVSPRPKNVRRLRGAKTKVKRILNKETLTHIILYVVESISQAGKLFVKLRVTQGRGHGTALWHCIPVSPMVKKNHEL
jgi:hypothetical protein